MEDGRSTAYFLYNYYYMHKPWGIHAQASLFFFFGHFYLFSWSRGRYTRAKPVRDTGFRRVKICVPIPLPVRTRNENPHRLQNPCHSLGIGCPLTVPTTAAIHSVNTRRPSAPTHNPEQS